MKDISNANWFGKQFGAFGWVVHVRIRRKGRRQTYRRWVKVDVFNYNYSDEAKRKSIEREKVLDE